MFPAILLKQTLWAGKKVRLGRKLLVTLATVGISFRKKTPNSNIFMTTCKSITPSFHPLLRILRQSR